LLFAGVSGCEFDAGTAPAIVPRLVVHAVLNPQAREQVVLLEQTRAGSAAVGVDPGATPVDSLDPILARGGLPISGARVVLFAPTGDSAVAVEDAAVRPDGMGAGVYRIRNVALGAAPAGAPDAAPILAGQTYRLRVQTPLGTATGETTIPFTPERVDTCTSRIDVWAGIGLGFSAPPVTGGPTPPVYLVRVEAPFGARMEFASGAPALRIGGSGGPRVYLWVEHPQGLRLEVLAALLPPGFRQSVGVAAVDSNYHNYYRDALEDPFGSESRASSIRGGVGLFGSAVLLAARTVELYSTASEPIVGRYVPSASAPGLPDTLDLYVSAPWQQSGTGGYNPFWGRYKFNDGRQGAVSGSTVTSTGATAIDLVLHDGRDAAALYRRIGFFVNADFDGQSTINVTVGTLDFTYRRIRTSPPPPSVGSCR